MGLGIILIWLLNLGISIFNAWGCGKTWNFAKAQGGWEYLVLWCGAIMSACGFTWCYLAVLAFLAHSCNWLSPHYLVIMLELGYLVIIPAAIGSGLIITIDSWIMFWRQKSVTTGLIAGYNTYAQISNTLDAISFLPQVVKDLTGQLGEESDDTTERGWALAVSFVVLAVLFGVLTTRYIILRVAAAA